MRHTADVAAGCQTAATHTQRQSVPRRRRRECEAGLHREAPTPDATLRATSVAPAMTMTPDATTAAQAGQNWRQAAVVVWRYKSVWGVGGARLTTTGPAECGAPRPTLLAAVTQMEPS